MRAQLVDWMMEVSASFLVRRRTLQTAVNFCDRFLAACPTAFPRDRLQLLGECVPCLALTRPNSMSASLPSTDVNHPWLELNPRSRQRPLRCRQDGGNLSAQGAGDGGHHGRGHRRQGHPGLRAGAHDDARVEPRAADRGRLGGRVRCLALPCHALPALLAPISDHTPPHRHRHRHRLCTGTSSPSSTASPTPPSASPRPSRGGCSSCSTSRSWT